MPNFIAAGGARLIAVVLVSLLGYIGLKVTEEEIYIFVVVFWGILTALYGVIRPIISRYVHPKDDALPVDNRTKA